MVEAGDRWATGDLYEPYVGRWSRVVAGEFLAWLGAPPSLDWLDIGCGTGALVEAIAERCHPRHLAGIDPSEAFLAFARQRLGPGRATLQQGDASDLSFPAATFDRVVSGLVLNFVPDPARAVAEMVRVARPGGEIALYVWDYAGRMQLMRHFWDAAVALDPRARDADEGRRFPICRPEALRGLLEAAMLTGVEVQALEIDTVFRDFDDYWTPFLGGQGPAPGYCMSLSEQARTRLRDTLRHSLVVQADGRIPLVARAWAVRGHRR
jgi:SAM-dependent methyltransferase